MRGTDIAKQLSEPYSTEREKQILEHVRAGHFVLHWLPITVKYGPRTAMFWVTNDALRLGDATDSFRPGMSHKTQQQIADELNAVNPTAKLSDEIYRSADVRILPNLVFGGPKMANLSTMLKYSASVDSRIQKAMAELYGGEVDPAEVLISTVGKDWVNSRRLLGRPMVQGAPAAINYGGHRQDMGTRPKTGPFPSATSYPPVVVHQSEGMAHSFHHADYSQVGRFVAREVMVCEPLSPVAGFGQLPQKGSNCMPGVDCELVSGEPGLTYCWDIYDLAQDPDRWHLVSADGPVYMRHFAVPYERPQGAGKGLWPGIPDAPPASRVPVPEPALSASMGVKTLAIGAGIAVGWYALGQLLEQRADRKRRRRR